MNKPTNPAGGDLPEPAAPRDRSRNRSLAINGMLDWVLAPSAEHGVRFMDDDGTWRLHTYAELAEGTCAVAGRLVAEGLERDQVVVVLHRTGPQFVSSFFGVLMAGGTASPLAPPLALGAGDAWIQHAAHVINGTGARFVLADEDFLPLAERAVEAAGGDCRVISPTGRDHRIAVPRPPARSALLQFTSGSRGPSRGVRVGLDNLESNLGMVHRWMRAGSVSGASWLPLYHDMGLVGGLLVPVVHQMTLGLMRPEQFIATPLRWLAEYGERDGEIMVMPNFGFDYIVRRVRPDAIRHMDFSSVRVVITGAERVRPTSLTAFSRLLGPRGFAPTAFQPAYGLAEATLAVTGVGFGEVPRVAGVAPGRLELGQAMEIIETRPLPDFMTGPGPERGLEAREEPLWHMSCGRPLEGLTVEIVDDLGVPLPEGHVGEIAVRGPSVAQGYIRPDREASTRFEGDRLFTGDAGFLHDGELFVLGRIGDSLQVRGRNLYVEDIEQALSEEGLFVWYRMAALAGFLDDVPTVYLLTESGLGHDRTEQAMGVISRLAGPGVAVRLVRVPRSSIEVTSSGKPRRRRMWQRVLAGELTGELLAALDAEGVLVTTDRREAP